jgi:glycosyltransferase involved in cell wall biosynthesis
MGADPKVSVIMPVRNGERWLAPAVESILGQTLSDLELIVVDDGSIDTSAQILSALRRRDPRLRLTHQQPDGLVAALNRALALARAPLVARLDADDVALPERLDRQAACFERHDRLVLLGSWAEKIGAEGRCIGYLKPKNEPDRLAETLLRRNPFIHSSVMMRTALVRELGGYRRAFLAAEDFDLWLRLSEHGAVANLAETLTQYRCHDANATRRQAVRQCFSSRLAVAASALRRSSGFDPADRLLGPPDWWAPDALREFYAESALICRFLDLADVATLVLGRMADVQVPGLKQILDFSHAEKRLARCAIFNLRQAREAPPGFSFVRGAAVLLTLLMGRAVHRARS